MNAYRFTQKCIVSYIRVQIRQVVISEEATDIVCGGQVSREESAPRPLSGNREVVVGVEERVV